MRKWIIRLYKKIRFKIKWENAKTFASCDCGHPEDYDTCHYYKVIDGKIYIVDTVQNK